MKRRVFLNLTAVLTLAGCYRQPTVPKTLPEAPPVPMLPDGTYARLVDVFGEIRAFVAKYPGTQVLSCDDEERLEIGWVAISTTPQWDVRQIWSFRLKTIKQQAAYEGLGEWKEYVWASLRKPSGRADLARWLASPE